MIISKVVKVKIVPGNFKHYKEKGYSLSPLGAPKHGFEYYEIEVDINDLKGQTIDVECKCDLCGEEFTQRICRNTDTCYKCRNYINLLGNTNGSGNKGKILLKNRGENHPRWNPNKSEYRKYSSKVMSLTKRHKSIWSTWENADKIGMCGVEGAYQLDHKVSIKYGFYNNIPAEIIASLANLEIITWESNRNKSGNCTIDLWDLLS